MREEGSGCFTMIMFALFNVALGGVSVDYILSWFGKDIPFLADSLIGLFAGEISIPVAVIGWVLNSFGVL